jgi:hypothetical protein
MLKYSVGSRVKVLKQGKYFGLMGTVMDLLSSDLAIS